MKDAAEVNKARNDGVAPLYVATAKGRSEIVGLLIKHGAVETPVAFADGAMLKRLERISRDAATLAALARQRCATCNKLCKVRWCSKCRKKGYCSAKCQATDWPRHKPECCMWQEADTGAYVC